MKNLWSDVEATSYVQYYAKKKINEDIALRIYSSRLLGGEPRLVLHGGGNTSVKTTVKDVAGIKTDVLCVKGSGWDLESIEPAGLPAVRLKPLLGMEDLKKLSDEDMINAQRTNLLDASSPNPSVETLLHAFLPHKFIDHTHSNAVLGLSDQSNGYKICHEVFGDQMGFVPYIMPGFALAKAAVKIYRQKPSVRGLILLNHGIFTFSETAKETYDIMIKMVTRAEKRLAEGSKHPFVQIRLPNKLASLHDVAPILRGLIHYEGRPMVLDFRTSKEILSFVGGKDISQYSTQGTVTPDHVIRTKQKPLILTAPEVGKLKLFKAQAKKNIGKYIADYHKYFRRHNKRYKGGKTELDPMPRMILVPGLGVFGLGGSSRAAAIVADLLETNISVITKAEAMGRYEVISEREIFDIEYWSLEQAKLGKIKKKSLSSKIAVITGAGSGIGEATAKAFSDEGAEVCVLDRDIRAAERVAQAISGLAIKCDVTKEEEVKKAFQEILESRGGLDILISNAGGSWQGKIGDVNEKFLRESFELNFWAHQRVAQKAVHIMKSQGNGGCLLFNISKQAINPGKEFGPYGLPKAATLFLMKQYALDHGADGIRSNAVNADRIRSGFLDEKMIQSRSKARGLSENEYMSGNLLGQEVKVEQVAQAFLALAKADATTAATITVDGGNIEASLR